MSAEEIAAASPPSDRPAGIRKSDSYSPELEALRGWAILLVVTFHIDSILMGIGRVGTDVSPMLAFVTAGHTGVTLFFVLSAFLLSRPFLSEATTGRSVRLPDFFRRRALRIMPLYTAAVVFAVVFRFQEPGALIDGVRSLFFLNWGTPMSLYPYSAVWWSLATEAQFYVVLPALALCRRSKLGMGIGIAGLLIWGVAYSAILTGHIPVTINNLAPLSFWLPVRAPAFLAGIGAAWLVLHYGDRIRAAGQQSVWFRNGGADLALLVTLWALGRLLQVVTFRGFFQVEFGWVEWHLAESGLWTLVVLLVLLAPLRLRPLISNRVLVTVGMLSYSVYIVHEPILHYASGWIGSFGLPLMTNLPLRGAVMLGMLGLCVAVSVLTYRWIEKPFLVRKAKIDG